jgi:hypothetical protein
MSKNLSSAQAEEFDALVHHVYQADGKLRGAVTHRGGVVGGIYHFRTMGKGLANQKASQADVTPMDVAHTKVNCVLENWNAPEYTDIFDQAEVNFDEKSQLAKTIGMAIRRREDQLIIDALDASTPTATIATSVGGAGTGLNLAKIRAAMSALDNNGVPEEGRTIISSSLSKATLLAETEVGSSDYNSIRALVNAEIDTFLGFNFIWVPANSEGGITVASTVYDGYAFHRDAIGLAVGIDLKTEINYVAEKTSWLCNGLLKAGSVAIDETGIVKIQSTQA